MSEDCVKCLLRSDQIIKPDEIPLMTQYIPYRMVRAIGELPCCFFERKLELLTGVVVYFDIVGFTATVANHVNAGRDVGMLSDVFRSYYSLIIETIQSMGGSVFQFAGDSLLICFERYYGESEEQNWRRALTAMDVALERSNAYNAENSGANGFVLDPKIGIGFGQFHQILLGDRTRFITPVIAGAAVDEAISSERGCNGREILIGERAYQFACSIGLRDCFAGKGAGYLLLGLPDDFHETVEAPAFCDERLLFDNPRYYNRINAFINPMIQHQIKTHFQGFVGEYREISCAMVRFDGFFAQTTDEFDLVKGYGNLNAVYSLVQDKATRYGGFCTTPDLSDKGTVFPILFGAPVALENKERNAVLCADEILRATGQFPFISSVNIGIATGDVYCGEFGGITRKDYSVVGSMINLAARLMMTGDRNAVFMDDTTRRKTESLCEVESAKGIYLKGFSREQAVFRFTDLRKEKRSDKKRVGMIGRDRELARLNAAFAESLKGEIRFCPVIGDAGMGKSYLVENFLNGLPDLSRETRVLFGSCYQYEESTIFFPWRSIIKAVVGIEEDMPNEDMLARVTDIFRERFAITDLVWITFFLNMLGYDFEEHEAVKEIDVSIKQDRFFAFVYRILVEKARETPLVVIIEDIHWSDAVSLKMLEYLINGASAASLLVIPVSRESESVISFFNRYSVPFLKLEQLRPEAARELATRLLNMDPPERALVEKIVNTSDSNPFFIENIVQNMIESGVLVEATNGTYFLSKDIKNINIPSSIQNIILARLNSLLFEEQVVCKTASVIGRSFLSDILRALVPEGISEYIFLNALENFETHNLILREDERRSAYYFKHITIRDVVYNTILESTRKELNIMLLSYLENRYSDNINAVVERLEYHASEAESWPLVYKYALQSAVKSEKQFSTLDAIVHYQNALDALGKIEMEDREDRINDIHLSLAAAYRKSSDYERSLEMYGAMLERESRPWYRAAILQGIGQCKQEQGRFDEAVSALEASLSILGYRAPRGKAATYMSVVKAVLAQLANHFLFGNDVRELTGKKREYAEMRTDILSVLTKLYYFGKPEKIAWASVCNFNNMLAIRSLSDKWVMSECNYAVSLVSVGLSSLGLSHFENASKVIARSKSRTAVSIYKSRYAFYFLFYSQPHKSIELLEDATNHFRSIGETWELMTGLGALAQNYFLISDLQKSERAYLETERVARKLHSTMHIGWSYNKVPFIRYLQGTMTATEAKTMLSEGIEMSSIVQDHMTLCIHYGHLAYIAEKENDIEGAVKYAKNIIRENRLYTVNVPHVKISYVNAVEALCFALESGSSSVPRGKAARMARRALSRALGLGETFELIRGPAYRAAARLALLEKKGERARALCARSLECLSNGPYECEYAQTLELAARCFPENAKANLAHAELIRKKIGVVRR